MLGARDVSLHGTVEMGRLIGVIGLQKSRKIIRAAKGIASAEDTAMPLSEHYQTNSCTISNSTFVTCATSLFTFSEEGFERGQQQDLVLASSWVTHKIPHVLNQKT